MLRMAARHRGQIRPAAAVVPAERFLRWTDVLLVLAFLLSTAWSLALAVLQLAPTWAANWLMRTEDLDFGDFWNLSRADDRLATAAAVLLAAFALGYSSLTLQLIARCWRRPRGRIKPQRTVLVRDPTQAMPPETPGHGLRWVAHENRLKPGVSEPETPGLRSSVGICARARVFLALEDSPVWALPKLALQTTTLFRYLQEGFPTQVIFTYASLLFFNWLIASFCIATRQNDQRSVHAQLFSSFDLFFAVLAPLHVLVWAYLDFDFNREEFATRTEAFPSANFDRTARLFADPTKVSLFRIAFQSLQVSTVTTLLVKSCLNIVTIRKWWRTISRLHGGSVDASVAVSHASPLVRRRHMIFAAAVACIGAGILIYSVTAVVTTTSACEAFAQCGVLSYEWNTGPSGRCSCVVFIDRKTVLTTFAEWENPVDTSTNLATLAAAGRLKIVQIVNRQLPTLPDELRLCRHMQQLVLLYTKTIVIPDWTREFVHLEYLHIQGDFLRKQLISLPVGLFGSMPRLIFLHLGTLPTMPSIPSLGGLFRLRYLTLAVLHSVHTIPDFDDLASLEQLSLSDLIRVYSLPSFHQLSRLRVFGIISRNPICCNGYVTGVCDLKDFACKDRTTSGEPRVGCTNERMSAEDHSLLYRTLGSVCEPPAGGVDLKDVQATFASTDLACGGVMFKKCTLLGKPGMCFPSRMMPVSCQLNKAFQKMRQLQIERQVGVPCDPQVEAWLGCRS